MLRREGEVFLFGTAIAGHSSKRGRPGSAFERESIQTPHRWPNRQALRTVMREPFDRAGKTRGGRSRNPLPDSSATQPQVTALFKVF
jgi:hypothetical protein